MRNNNETIVNNIHIDKDPIFLMILFFLLLRGLFSVSAGANNRNDKNAVHGDRNKW